MVSVRPRALAASLAAWPGLPYKVAHLPPPPTLQPPTTTAICKLLSSTAPLWLPVGAQQSAPHERPATRYVSQSFALLSKSLRALSDNLIRAGGRTQGFLEPNTCTHARLCATSSMVAYLVSHTHTPCLLEHCTLFALCTVDRAIYPSCPKSMRGAFNPAFGNVLLCPP